MTHLFSNVQGIFSRIHHLLGHKTILNKFKKIEIISSIFYDHNSMTLEVKYKKKTAKKRHKHMET